MSDLGHNAGMILQMVIGAFSWAICLGVLSRVVFQARWQTTTKFVGAGCAINIALMILIGFSLPFSQQMYTKADWRNEYLHWIFLLIPIAVTLLTLGYLQFRRREWNPDETDSDNEDQEQNTGRTSQVNKETP